MGQEIVYCFKCLTRLTGGDFEKSKAFRYGPRVSCKPCLPHLLQDLSPAEQEEFLRASKPAEHASSTGLSITPRPSTARRRSEVESVPPSGKGKLVGMALGGGAVLLLAIGLVLLRTPPEPPPSSSEDSPPVAPAPAKESEALRLARRAVEKARDPSITDPEVRLALWAEAVKASRGTPLQGEAVDAERELIEWRMAARGKELAELDDAARPLMVGDEHAKAAAIYEAARVRHPEGEWGFALTERVAATRRDATEVARRLTDGAVEASRKGDAAAVRASEEAVARIGYPELLTEFRAAVAGVKPAAKPVVAPPPSAESKAYREGWMKLAERTAARDFEGAIAEQTKLKSEMTEAETKMDASRDLDDLLKLKELAAELGRNSDRLPIGRDLALEAFGGDGARLPVKGKLLRAWPGRVEISGEPPVIVELEDLCASSIADLLLLTRKLSGLDVRALALLCAAEGDGTRALRLSPTIPERVRALIKEGASRAPKRSEKDQETRKLFYDAERAYRDLASRADAVLLYRKLAADLADVGIVKREIELVRRRAEEGREAFLSAGLVKTGGTFKPSKDEKLGIVWTSADDSDPAKAVANFLEFEFLAVADSAYKAWVYAGGCCGEVFTFSLQASDLLGPKAASAAPGSETHVPVRHGLSSVKARHEDHMGPKSPKRWAWVPLPLPKFPAGGVKRVRVLTNQKGFSVACAFVSSVKPSPPGDAELRERLGRSKDVAADPALVAWWRMDESGLETSGQGSLALPKGAVEWLQDGKIGGALKTGPGWLEAPHQPALNAFPITVSAWARTTSKGDRMGLVNKYVANSGNGWNLWIHKGELRGWHIRTTSDKVMEGSEGLNGGPINNGAWRHVALVVDPEGGKLYVDGVRKIHSAWKGTPGPVTTTQALSVGTYPGTSGLKTFDGAIDDVRIHARALSDAEVMALYVAGGGTPEAARPWTPLFDGKPGFLSRDSETQWKLEDGALVRIPGSNDSAQSRLDVEDGEFRIRVEASGLSKLSVAIRQGAGMACYVEAKGPVPDGTREFVFTCAGDDVKATIDGKAATVEFDGRPRKGRLQFNYNGKSMKILSVEQRPLP